MVESAGVELGESGALSGSPRNVPIENTPRPGVRPRGVAFTFGSLVRVAVGVFRVLVSVFAVLVGRLRVLFGFVVLAVRVVVGGLEVVVCGGVVPRSGQVVVFHRRVLVRAGHRKSPPVRRAGVAADSGPNTSALYEVRRSRGPAARTRPAALCRAGGGRSTNTPAALVRPLFIVTCDLARRIWPPGQAALHRSQVTGPAHLVWGKPAQSGIRHTTPWRPWPPVSRVQDAPDCG